MRALNALFVIAMFGLCKAAEDPTCQQHDKQVLLQSRSMVETVATSESEQERQTVIKDAIVAINCVYKRMLLDHFKISDATDVEDEALAAEMVDLIEQEGTSTATPTLEETTKDLWQTYSEAYCCMSGDSADCQTDFATWLSKFEAASDGTGESTLLSQEKAKLSKSSDAAMTINEISELHFGTNHASEGRQVLEHSLTRVSRDFKLLQIRGFSKSQVLQLVAKIAVESQPASVKKTITSEKASCLKKMMLLTEKMEETLGETKETATGANLQASADILSHSETCPQDAQDTSLLELMQEAGKAFMQLHCAESDDCANTYAQVVHGASDFDKSSSSLLQTVKDASKAASFVIRRGAVGMAMRLFGLKRFTADVFKNRSASSIFDVKTTDEDLEVLAHIRKHVHATMHGRGLGAASMIRVMADLLQVEL